MPDLPAPERDSPFEDPVWLAEAQAWIEALVEVDGEIEQPHIRPWATVLRVPTPAGPVWFKAARDAFAYEAAVLEVLQPLAPELLPEVLAARPERGWLLLADGGERVREHPVDWGALLVRYAALQIAAVPHAGRLLEAGALDDRPPALAEHIDALFPWLSPGAAAGLRARLPETFERVALLEASPLPATIEHGDLHDGNVFVRDGRVRILDWGDANVAHPFFTLSVGAEPAEREAYLEAWTAYAPRRELEEEAAVVEELRFLLRALNWERVVAYDPSWAVNIEDRIVRFLGSG